MLKKLEPLLREVRKSSLKEKKFGVFYRGSSAYLHFHEDKEGIFVDIKRSKKWVRIKVPDDKIKWRKFSKKLLQ